MRRSACTASCSFAVCRLSFTSTTWLIYGTSCSNYRPIYIDGEWIHEVIDDKLYLAKQDFHESLTEQGNWAAATDLEDPDERYRKAMQTGSIALSFARCRNDNETWLPLLEKAYEKAHGDYGSIDGGWVG